MKAAVVEVRRSHWGCHHRLLRFSFESRVYYAAPCTAPEGAVTFCDEPGLDVRELAKKREFELSDEAAWRLIFAIELEPLFERLRAEARMPPGKLLGSEPLYDVLEAAD